MLAVFAALRLLPPTGVWTQDWIVAHRRKWLILIGVVHGLSNLGGGLLTILAAARRSGKETFRGLIAFCYTCFAVIQLCVLAVFSPSLLGWHQLGYVAVSTSVFVLIGQRAFHRVSGPIFESF
jgi:hypothetical protein